MSTDGPRVGQPMTKVQPMAIGRVIPWALSALLGVAGPACADEPGKNGQRIYKEICARCHGANGEGSKSEFPHPLTGDKSVEQLTKYIAKSMPEDDPGTVTGDDAKKVAEFVFETFYSATARTRNTPARIELSRLTVRQYRNAIADLVSSFRGSANWGDERGLHGEYFNSRNFQNNKRIIDRTDRQVKFDFGTEGPIPDKFDPILFCIRWQGSVLAPETGEYEFIVRTDQACQLWVNDEKRALIDAWVKSGNDTEFRGSLFLIAGRAYPIRLEFSKAKQGVDDTKDGKKKPPPKPASITLAWRPPRQAIEPIPSRYLSPARFSESFVVTTPFPPDDRSYGWEKATSISKAWDQATTDGAIDTAGYVVAHLNELASTRDGGRDRAAKTREFCRAFVQRAFRRPLTDELKAIYVDRPLDSSPDIESAVKRVVLLTLKSPRFLYREVGNASDGYDVASRLSFGLWDSLPDKTLLDIAAAGKLMNREQVASQAERMLPDLRTKAKLRDFLFTWLKVEPAPDLSKSPERFPGFDPSLASDLRSSLDLFLDDVVWGESSDFRALLLSDSLFLNGRLGKFYGADLPADAPYQKVSFDPKTRAGVLTHPYLLATFAYTASSSPIHRGVFLARNVLGQTLRPPPEAFAPLAAEIVPDLTTRERVALQTKPQACQSCHNMINPLGFTLENFDAVGRFREAENGKPIDASGAYQTRSGEVVRLNGVRGLATFLAASPEVHEAFVERVFHHLVKQPVRAYGPNRLEELRQSFAQNGYSVRRLMVEIMATTSLTGRKDS
jgi:mono/diheme cytochrome c family protein